MKKHVENVFILKGEPKGKLFDPNYSAMRNSDGIVIEGKVRDLYELHELSLAKLNQIKLVDQN